MMNLKLFIFFCIFFVLLSGEHSYSNVILCIVLSTLSIFFIRKIKVPLSISVDGIKELRTIFCFFGLIIEIFKSSIQTIKIIFSREEGVGQFVSIKKIPNDFEKTVFMNSITITPGTLSINSNDKEIMVHAIDSSMADSIAENKKTVRSLFDD